MLSAPRFATYLAEKASNKEAALELYRWNMELSAAFFVPLQICEVSVRNSIVTAIERTYGPNWPWEKGFEISLRNPVIGYSPRRDLLGLSRLPTSGKIVAELKFVFWERMFTKSHDAVIWNKQFKTVFPNTDPLKTIQQLRAEGFDRLARSAICAIASLITSQFSGAMFKRSTTGFEPLWPGPMRPPPIGSTRLRLLQR